jgi:hypothetical protein
MNVDASTYPDDKVVGSSEILAKLRAIVETMQCPSAFLSGVELALILKTVAEHALIMACLISDL